MQKRFQRGSGPGGAGGRGRTEVDGVLGPEEVDADDGEDGRDEEEDGQRRRHRHQRCGPPVSRLPSSRAPLIIAPLIIAPLTPWFRKKNNRKLDFSDDTATCGSLGADLRKGSRLLPGEGVGGRGALVYAEVFGVRLRARRCRRAMASLEASSSTRNAAGGIGGGGNSGGGRAGGWVVAACWRERLCVWRGPGERGATVAEGLEDHLAGREAAEGAADVEEADDTDYFEVLRVELRQQKSAELEEDRGEKEPVGGAEDEWGAVEAAPVAEDVDAKLREEEGAE